jgi:hypothetical protein
MQDGPQGEASPMTEHRVSLRSLTLRRYEDPARSRDPRVRAVVTGLRTLDVAPAPRAHFRAELRAQLVAVAPRLITDGIAAEDQMIDIVPRPSTEPVSGQAERSRGARVAAGLRSIPIARPLGIAATLITVFALLLGGAVYLSRNALPGDALYGLKRARENFQYAMAGSDQERANLLLDFAGTRVDEAQGLIDRSSATALGDGASAGGGISAETEQLINSNLSSADGDVRNAAQLLGNDAVKSDNPHPLATITAWAPGQLARLHRLANAMPVGILRARTNQSSELVQAAAHRAKKLQTKVNCGAPTSTHSDQLGPVPSAGCGSTPPVVPGKHQKKHRHHAHHNRGGKPASSPVSAPIVATTPAPGDTHHPGAGPSIGPSNLPSTHKPPITLPTLPSLPNPLPSASIGVTLTHCHLGLGLGIIVVSVDTCTLMGGTPHNH